MTQALRAVLFDVFGTLLDVHSVAQSAERVFPGAGMHLSLLWRDKQIEYSRVRALSQRYVLFSELTRDALRYAADVLALPLNDAICDALMNEYSHLSPFADARPALMRWQQQGAALGVLSNGDREMLVRALRGAAIDEFFPQPSINSDRIDCACPPRRSCSFRVTAGMLPERSGSVIEVSGSTATPRRASASGPPMTVADEIWAQPPTISLPIPRSNR